MTKPLSQFPSEDHTISSSDGESLIFIRSFGSSRPQLHFLLVHGALEHSGRHGDLIAFLLKKFGREVSVTVYDHIGHGKSGGVRAYCESFNHYVEDMNLVGTFIQQRNTPETKNFILAHSLGGLITIRDPFMVII